MNNVTKGCPLQARTPAEVKARKALPGILPVLFRDIYADSNIQNKKGTLDHNEHRQKERGERTSLLNLRWEPRG